MSSIDDLLSRSGAAGCTSDPAVEPVPSGADELERLRNLSLEDETPAAALPKDGDPSPEPPTPDDDLEATFCRFKNGTLERETLKISSASYIAISHVWGIASWHPTLKNVPREVLASAEKVLFIEEKLPTIAGDSWFWMDVLSVDQRSKSAVIGVMQSIPAIYRCAERTVVVREGNGFRQCCLDSVGDKWDFFSRDPNGRRMLRDHLEQEHGNEKGFGEGTLTRLWPLQEVVLSDKLEFVRCDLAPTEEKADEEGQQYVVPEPFVAELSACLSSLAQSWCIYGEPDGTDLYDGRLKTFFVDAYLHCRTISRSKPRNSRNAGADVMYPTGREILLHINSMRRTSKPRDFILAVMPQYRFYRVPENAKRMKFSELFADCCKQLRDASPDHTESEEGGDITGLFAPLITDEVDLVESKVSGKPTDVPEPVCLGDLVKLFNGPTIRNPRRHIELHSLSSVEPAFSSKDIDILFARMGDIEQDEYTRKVTEAGLAVHLLTRSIMSSHILWRLSAEELLREIHYYKSLPVEHITEEYTDFAQACQSLLYIIFGIDGSVGSYENACAITMDSRVIRSLTSVPVEKVVLLAAMVACGLGVSAFDWAKENLTALKLVVNNTTFLALARKELVRWKSEGAEEDTFFGLIDCGDFIIGGNLMRAKPQKRMALLAGNADQEGFFRPCLFPPDIGTVVYPEVLFD